MKKQIFDLFCISSVAASISMPLMAQENPVATTPRDFEKPASAGQPDWEGGVNLGYVAGSSGKFMGNRTGNSEAFNANVETGRHVTINEDWFLNLGLVSDNIFLSQISGEPVPSRINTLRLNFGLGYRLNEKWTLTGLASPSLYRFDDVNGNAFGASGGAIATYQQNPRLTWSFGMIGSPDSDVPVLPIVGVRWKLDDQYTLEVGMPRTRLSYLVESGWSLYGGLDFVGTTFRTEKDLGTRTGNTPYNDALASYRDIRLGLGTSYAFGHGIRAEIETGASVYREIYFKDIDQSVKFKPAPYVRLGLSARF